MLIQENLLLVQEEDLGYPGNPGGPMAPMGPLDPWALWTHGPFGPMGLYGPMGPMDPMAFGPWALWTPQGTQGDPRRRGLISMEKAMEVTASWTISWREVGRG